MLKKEKPFILLILGPTGVGKTDLSLELAEHLQAEIVNGDSGQFYTPFSIGTAKPDWKNEKIPHHLFDIIDEPKNITVFEYRKVFLKVINDIWSRGKVPIVVGGSGFYLKSIFFPPISNENIEKSKIDTFFGNKEEKKALSFKLWDKLNQIDSIRASEIDKNDLYRIQRAIHIWDSTGKKPSYFKPVYNSDIDFFMIYLSRDKDDLYDRINKRTIQMLNGGWIEEAENLKGTVWELFLYKKKLIGYDILFDFLLSKKTDKDFNLVVKEIQKVTRNYAKRQKTFWKSLKRQLDDAFSEMSGSDSYGETELINLTLLDRHLYIKQLLKRLRPHIKKSVII